MVAWGHTSLLGTGAGIGHAMNTKLFLSGNEAVAQRQRRTAVNAPVTESCSPMPQQSSSSPSAAPRLGVGMECLDRALWDHRPALPSLATLGVRRVRLQSGWARTERERGVLDFSWLDGIVGDLAAIGVEPWISLSYGNPLYGATPEAAADYTGQSVFPLQNEETAAAWKRYVAAIVRRYRDRVRVWEIWNESDVSVFLKVAAGGNWAAEYARLVRLTAPIVRAAAPEARIAVCTAAGPGMGGARAAALFAQGIGDCADIYSFHAYEAVPEQFSPAARSAFYAAIRRYAPKIEFWRGEAGISSVAAGKGALMWLPLSEEMQARWMSRHLVRDLADPDLAFTSWFHLASFRHFSGKCTYHYGVVREGDFSPKPSFHVLRRIASLFDDGRCAPDASTSLALHAARLPDGTEQPPQRQALAAGAAVHAFRRNGFPLFAATALWPAHEAMPPVRVDATLFDGGAAAPEHAVWREPVLLDLLDGTVAPLTPFGDGFRVSFDLANHVRVVTERDALVGVSGLALPAAAAERPADAPPSQSTHE